ncbi:carbohydrate ABC transporter permease [Cohnella sp. F6_2S_P_1]|uniref:Carbohydrate ABC transporter permease n=2 Tax=Cohnella hashimotonis TaxID=2826895 RepID=A0ABT6TTR3_9BACL|nr:carbohydrate ABC transporter permease [Cohnella hashimotonis]MDI4649568.1 carbohydrate ABC transporter permease [Cohnella hashimotonis]
MTGIAPIALMLLSSLKSNIEIIKNPLSLPTGFDLSSYRELFRQLPYGHYFFNSVLVTVVSVLAILTFGALASYYMARYSFRWNQWMYMYFLAGMMIPIKLGVVPLFMLMRNLHLINTPWSLILIYTAVGIPLAILILTGFFRTMPTEIEEAARIDGSSELGILFRVLVPLMRPALSTVMIIQFINIWNDFFFPLLFAQDESAKTLQIGMMSLFGEFSTDWSVLFAGLTVASLPMMILFLFASRQFMEGLTAGAVK